VPSYYPGAEAVRRTLDLRDAMQRVFDKYPDQIALATSAHDVERIVGEKKIAVVLAVKRRSISTSVSLPEVSVPPFNHQAQDATIGSVCT
jgi:membrane dipeptidase